MKLTVPTAYTTDFLDRMQALNQEFAARGNQVAEVYGSFQSSRFSSARPSTYLLDVSREQFRAHVREALDRNIRFNYLFNAPSYVNLEYTADGQRELEEDVRFLVDCGVHSVTVAIPYVMEIIAARFPEIEVVVSTIGAVNAMRGFEQYERIGVKRVVLDVEVNRDFNFLERAVKSTDLALEVLVNPVCLYQCHFKQSHYCATGHGSQKSGDGSGIGHVHNQYYVHRCYLQRLETEDEYIKGPWIRPEDIHYYNDAGLKYFKIAGRGSPPERIERIARAYMSEDYDGNLVELLGWPHWEKFATSADGTVLDPLKVNIDNKSLDGFVRFFTNKRPDCRLGCNDCDYCTKWAQRTVKLSDPDLRDKYVRNMKQHILHNIRTRPSPEATKRTQQRWQDVAGSREVD